MNDDFTMPCVECLLHHPYKHDEPWACPACGLIHAVVMPGVPLAMLGVVETRPKWMTPEREEAIEDCLTCAEEWSTGCITSFVTCGMAMDAFRAVPAPGGRVRSHEDVLLYAWLEAAALLRDGWSPCDKVVRK